MAKFMFEFEIDDKFAYKGDFSGVCNKCPFSYNDEWGTRCFMTSVLCDELKEGECTLMKMKQTN
jgi:hypothetical protein